MHAADIHLDSPLRELSFEEGSQIDRLRRATRDAFERLVDFCIDQEAAFLILAGDLYDHDYPNMQVAVFFRKQLSRLYDKGIRVIIKKGNHDADNKITSALDLPSNTRVLSERHPETILFEDFPIKVAVHGQSFSPGPVTANLALSYPSPVPGYFNIGILHTSLAGSPDHDVYSPCKLEDLTTKGYDYWALGHVHKASVLSRNPWIVYPGNLQGRHSRETGPKGCVLVTVENDQVLHVESIPLDVIRWSQVRIDLAGGSSEIELMDKIRLELSKLLRESDGRPCAFRVNLIGSTLLHDTIENRPLRLRQGVLELAGEVGGDDLWLEKIKDYTTAVKTEHESDQGEAAGELLRIMRELLDEDEGVLAFLKTEIEPLRGKLPEDLKGLTGIDPQDGAQWVRETFARLESSLLLRLSGEKDS
ncbi:MAG: metallophosphoesterase family protein [Leptospirales bacterium]